MPIAYKIDPALSLLFYLAVGECGGREILQIERDAYAHELRQHGMKILWDAVDADVNFDVQDLKAGVALNRTLKERGKNPEATAFVTYNRAAHVLGDAYSLLADGLPIKLGVFMTIHEALIWLGLPNADEKVRQMRDELFNQLVARS